MRDHFVLCIAYHAPPPLPRTSLDVYLQQTNLINCSLLFYLNKKSCLRCGGTACLNSWQVSREQEFCCKVSAVFGLTTKKQKAIQYERYSHSAHTERQLPLSGVHSIMMEKLAQSGEGEGARPPPSTISTITYKVVVYVPAERADILPLFLLYPYRYSVVIARHL